MLIAIHCSFIGRHVPHSPSDWWIQIRTALTETVTLYWNNCETKASQRSKREAMKRWVREVVAPVKRKIHLLKQGASEWLIVLREGAAIIMSASFLMTLKVFKPKSHQVWQSLCFPHPTFSVHFLFPVSSKWDLTFHLTAVSLTVLFLSLIHFAKVHTVCFYGC